MNQYAGPAPEARLHAFRDDALGDHDATALADLLRRGERSAAQLTDAAIERIEAVNPQLNAVIMTRYDQGRAEAAGELPDGPLRGCPSC